MSDKNSLLAYREKLLEEIKYYETRITEAKVPQKIFKDNSDSDDETFTIQLPASFSKLKNERRMLSTCLQATLELTGLVILQSEVTPIAVDPVCESQPPVTEDGIWNDVAAECRLDLVLFSITFHVHKPKRLFGPFSYRNLKINIVKRKIETELQNSVLPTLKTPSDAIDVIRNYSVAHRSRRTTLLRLAEKYGESLHMDSLDDGGYVLKCADLMTVSWRLENKWSPLSPFHHKMVFDLEYMDEGFLKIIMHAHKQLSDPTIDTNERTHFLSKIIMTCLEAKKQEHNESAGSISTRLEEAQEMMAPPKSLPKKSKKSTQKRPSDAISDTSSKKAKINDDSNVAISKSEQLKVKSTQKPLNKSVAMSGEHKTQKNAKSVASNKNNQVETKSNNVAISSEQKTQKSVKNVASNKINHVEAKNNNVAISSEQKTQKSVKNVASNKINQVEGKNNNVAISSEQKTQKSVKNVASNKNNQPETKTNNIAISGEQKPQKSVKNSENNLHEPKRHSVAVSTQQKMQKSTKSVATTKNINQKNTTEIKTNNKENIDKTKKIKTKDVNNKTGKVNNIVNIKSKVNIIDDRIIQSGNAKSKINGNIQDGVKSKIPQKRVNGAINKLPVRISPRKTILLKTNSIKKSSSVKTSIPKLMKKPEAKNSI